GVVAFDLEARAHDAAVDDLTGVDRRRAARRLARVVGERRAVHVAEDADDVTDDGGVRARRHRHDVVLAERLGGEDRLFDVIARRRAFRLEDALLARDELNGLRRLNERAAQVVLIAGLTDDLGDVPGVHREREGAGAVLRRDAGAREHLRGRGRL